MAPLKTENLTAVLHGINDLRLEQRPIPEPNDDQVLLQMEVVGICGSDVHYLTKGCIGSFVVKKPMVIGHEASGTVIKIGKNVKNLKPGDRVAIEPGVSCRKCDYCKDGRYNLCLDIAFCATPPYDGNLTRYYVHDADFCFKLPDNVSLEEGALMEPLSVGVHGCKKGNVTIGSIVLILGAGPIGLVTMLAAKAFGASKVLIIDIVESRLNIAKKIGADYTLLIDPNSNAEVVVKNILDVLGSAPTVSIDCAGVELTINIGIKTTRPGGIIVLIGLGKSDINIPVADVIIKELKVKGVFRYANDYPTSIEMVKTGRINVKPLMTHHYKIEDTLKAFHTSSTGEGDAIKVLIHPNTEWKS